MITEDFSLSRLRWACRRGMLELDLIFEPYALSRYTQAPAEEQTLFVEFLSASDQDLFDWLLKKKQPDNPAFIKMIAILLNHATHAN